MARRCKYGKLKHKIGRRVCKLRPSKRGKRPAKRRYSSKASVSAERARELEYIARAKGLSGHRRRRR